MTKEINFTPVDTTSLRLGQQPAVTAERHGTSPISPKTTTNPLKAHPIQSQGGQILEGPGPHIPKHREHQGSATSGILRSQNSLAKLDTTMDTTGTKRPTFDDAAINKPRSDKAYPTTPYEKEKEGSKLKLKQKPLKVGMGQPIKQLAVKIRGKITGKDERAREAQLKARQASADAKALHEEVTGAPTGMSKMLQKVKSISILRKHDDDEPVANTREASATAVENARRTRSQWWPDWRQKSSKHSADLSDDDAKSRQRKIHQALQSFALQARGSTTAKKPFNSIDYARDYPDRPWDVPKSSGPVGHRTAEEMYYHPDMRPGDDLSEKFYVSGSTLTPLLLDEKGRPIRFAGHSSESSTATNWARGTVSKVEDIAGRTLMKVSQQYYTCMIWFSVNIIQVSGRKVKSEADALDNTTVERVSSWRARSRLVDANPPLNTLVEVASSESAVPPVDYSHMNGTAIQERPRQPSGIHEIPADEASEQQLSLTRFPSMPTEASSPSTVYEQSVHTCHSALAPNSQPSSVPALQAPSVPVHPIIAGGAVQPMSDISQAPPVPLQEPAPQRTANALTVPQTAGSTLLAVRGASSPSSTATDNVPSLIPDESSAGSASTSS